MTDGRQRRAREDKAAAAARTLCVSLREALRRQRAELASVRQQVVALADEARTGMAHVPSECAAAAALVARHGARREAEQEILKRVIAQGLPERQARMLVGLPSAVQGDGDAATARHGGARRAVATVSTVRTSG